MRDGGEGHHADPVGLQVVLGADVVDHERGRLADHRRVPAGAALDGARHGAVAGPLLRVGEVGDGVEVGGDELAALVLVDAELGVLDLVVVDVAVEAHHHGAHVVVVLQREACARPRV